MTDLLGLLSDLRNAATGRSAIRVVSGEIPGMAGVIDYETSTVHISPTLPPDEWLATLAEGLRSLNADTRGDPIGMETFGPVTADGAQVIPMRPRLRPVADS